MQVHLQSGYNLLCKFTSTPNVYKNTFCRSHYLVVPGSLQIPTPQIIFFQEWVWAVKPGDEVRWEMDTEILMNKDQTGTDIGDLSNLSIEFIVNLVYGLKYMLCHYMRDCDGSILVILDLECTSESILQLVT